MTVARTIAKNSLVLTTGQLVSYVLFFFSGIYTAIHLEPSGFGILSFAVGFTALFAFLPDLGLSILVVREVARDKSLAPKYLANVGLMKLILAVACFGLIALVVNIGQVVKGYPQETVIAVYLIGLSVVLNGLNHLAYAMFRAFQRMEYQSLGQMLSAALMLAGVIVRKIRPRNRLLRLSVLHRQRWDPSL